MQARVCLDTTFNLIKNMLVPWKAQCVVGVAGDRRTLIFGYAMILQEDALTQRRIQDAFNLIHCQYIALVDSQTVRALDLLQHWILYTRFFHCLSHPSCRTSTSTHRTIFTFTHSV